MQKYTYQKELNWVFSAKIEHHVYNQKQFCDIDNYSSFCTTHSILKKSPLEEKKNIKSLK